MGDPMTVRDNFLAALRNEHTRQMTVLRDLIFEGLIEGSNVDVLRMQYAALKSLDLSPTGETVEELSAQWPEGFPPMPDISVVEGPLIITPVNYGVVNVEQVLQKRAERSLEEHKRPRPVIKDMPGPFG